MLLAGVSIGDPVKTIMVGVGIYKQGCTWEVVSSVTRWLDFYNI